MGLQLYISVSSEGNKQPAGTLSFKAWVYILIQREYSHNSTLLDEIYLIFDSAVL